MQKIELTKKVIIELFVIAGLFLVLLFFAVSQKVTIGQKYQQVYFNGELVGNIASHVSVDDAVHEVRRELAAESDEPLCMDYEYSSSKANDWFTPLMTEDALKEALKEKMKVSEIETQVRAYTVAIEGYRGNFKSMDEVTEFLNTVKNEADTEGQYTTQISKEAGHISGIYTAQLTEVDPKENTEVTPEVTLADQVSAGANGAFTYQMEYAMANPRDDSYETGTIGMEFIERVEVYEKYISGDALSDVETQVEEVTKEKETNKIYVVESGDVLSVIAMDHDTTVANIMALNGFDNAEVRIYPGQEIIIAVPEPDLSLRIKKGEVYEEDYNAEPTIIKMMNGIRQNRWYTRKARPDTESVMTLSPMKMELRLRGSLRMRRSWWNRHRQSLSREQSRRQRISNHWQVGISHQDSDAAGEECTRALTGDARSEQPFMHPVQELLSVPVTAKDMAIMLSSAIRMAE